MNTRLLSLISAALLAISTPIMAAPVANVEKPADKRVELVQQVKTQDLYGMWAQAANEKEGMMLNMSIMAPDGQGLDLLILKVNDPDEKVSIKQKFSWSFDEKAQVLKETVLDFQVAHNDGEYETQRDEIGQQKASKVRLLKMDGEPAILELEEVETKEKISYFKQDEQKVKALLQQKIDAQP